MKKSKQVILDRIEEGILQSFLDCDYSKKEGHVEKENKYSDKAKNILKKAKIFSELELMGYPIEDVEAIYEHSVLTNLDPIEVGRVLIPFIGNKELVGKVFKAINIK